MAKCAATTVGNAIQQFGNSVIASRDFQLGFPIQLPNIKRNAFFYNQAFAFRAFTTFSAGCSQFG